MNGQLRPGVQGTAAAEMREEYHVAFAGKRGILVRAAETIKAAKQLLLKIPTSNVSRDDEKAPRDDEKKAPLPLILE